MCLFFQIKEMSSLNESFVSITDFIIVGFPGLQEYQNILFAAFLTLFLVTCTGNLSILCLVILDQRLHTPMYFFLWNLALLDVLIATALIPKMLAGFLSHNTVSFAECFLQMYFVISFGLTEIFLVAAMAYDRYIAVVKPLHYNVIINLKTCITMAATVWMLGFIIPLIPVALASYLPFCGSNKIMHCFCDYPAVISLACANVEEHAIGSLCLALTVIYVPFLFVLWTYFKIITSVLKLKTQESHKKAFSMCLSHVIIVLMYYISTAIVYIGLRIDSISYDGRIFIGGLNYFFTPMANPMIYSLRNKKIKAAVRKYFRLSNILPEIKQNSSSDA
ncbi:olfactory receptor 6N1-like [Erpetoichthys calabaricus]|uniref:olfactory receptor 6N1-like n=1 Tax=Erpetoichthys calabaricus TaxID=27687 RepID=UPI0022347C43|nr:olfactory receptor 6N1-like [Erpetoichthys calabaricus]